MGVAQGHPAARRALPSGRARPARRWLDGRAGPRVHRGRSPRRRAALLDALGLRRVGLVAHDFSAFVGFRLCFDHPERVAAFLCLGPHPYLRFKPQMLAGIPQLRFQPVVATPGLGPWALGTDRLARHLLRGPPPCPSRSPMKTWRSSPDASTRRGIPGGRLGAVPEPHSPRDGPFRGLGGVPQAAAHGPDRRAMGGADAGVRPGMLDVYGDQADDLVGHVVDGAGHYLADDRPDAVVTHALTLFGRVSRQTPDPAALRTFIEVLPRPERLRAH